MKHLILIVALIAGGIFVVHEVGLLNKDVPAVEQQMDEQTEKYVAAIEKDKYSLQEIKELNAAFGGCEIYIDSFKANGSKSTGDLIDRVKIVLYGDKENDIEPALDVEIGDNLAKQWNADLSDLKDIKSDEEDKGDFADRKKDIQNLCHKVRVALKHAGVNYDAEK